MARTCAEGSLLSRRLIAELPLAFNAALGTCCPLDRARPPYPEAADYAEDVAGFRP